MGIAHRDGSETPMDADAVLVVLSVLDRAGVEVWLDGGWGVDALLETQTREHADLDLIVSFHQARPLALALERAGFRRKPGGSDRNFVLGNPDVGVVDVHAIDFDDRGYGAFALPDGRKWPFPPTAFAGTGRVSGRPVRCLSAEAQVQCHGQGYPPTENDLRDMEHLQQRFGVVLPLPLCRALATGLGGSAGVADDVRPRVLESKFELFVSDAAASATFYSALGFEVVEAKPDGYTTLRSGPTVIALSPLPRWLPVHWLGFLRRPPIGTEIVLYTTGLETSRASLERAGHAPGAIALQPWGDRDFRITDPDGYYVRVSDGSSGALDP